MVLISNFLFGFFFLVWDYYRLYIKGGFELEMGQTNMDDLVVWYLLVRELYFSLIVGNWDTVDRDLTE